MGQFYFNPQKRKKSLSKSKIYKFVTESHAEINENECLNIRELLIFKHLFIQIEEKS